ncbi:MAG: serine/threonine-protein kinase [Planctomycetaceae bacterium]
MSEQYTLDAILEQSESGVVAATDRCTPDDGQTWIPVQELMDSHRSPSSDGTPPAGSNPETADRGDGVSLHPSSSSSSNGSAEDSNSDAEASASTVEHSQGTRKLKRLNRGSSESRFAKATRERETKKIRKPTDLIGAELADGRYQIRSELGRGSMAYVFLATDKRLQADAVVKIPKPEKFNTSDFSERFTRECQLLVRFSHPHVVSVLDVGEYEKLPYVVMQLLSGGSLADRMKKESDGQGRMTPESLKSWVREVARALDFCYRKGMVHRDIKPANILFDQDHNAFVSDFGLSKVMYGEHAELNSSETAAGIVLGTPNYISPEVVLGQNYDGRADQYSLGISIYHVLTGSPPMQGNSATATMVNQTQKTLDLLCDVRPDVSRPLANAVKKAIEKDPKKRFATCEEFAEAIFEGLKVAPVGGTSVRPAPLSVSAALNAVAAGAAPANTNPPAAASASTASDASSSGGRSASSVSSRSAAASGPKAQVSSGANPGPSGESSSSGSVQRRRSSSSSTATSLSDTDWLQPVDPALPRRRGSSTSGKSRATKRSAKSRTKAKSSSTAAPVKIFGMEMSPVMAGGLGLTLLLIFAAIISFRFFGSEEPEPAREVVAAASQPNDPGVPIVPPKNEPGGSKSEASDKPKNSNHKPASVAQANANQSGGSEKTKSYSSNPSTSENQNQAAGKSESVPAAAPASAPPKTVSNAAAADEAIPFDLKESFTVGGVDCPVVISGKRIWSTGSKTVTGQLEGQYDSRALTALSADGKLFAAATKLPDQQGGSVTVWDTSTGKPLFTTEADSKRFTDVILLSSSRLIVGDRWSPELLTWNCDGGKPGKPISIEEARLKPGSAAIAGDGKFIAAVGMGRLQVLSSGDGKRAGVMQDPAANPAQKRAPVSEKAMAAAANRPPGFRNGQSAEPVFAGLQALAFSPDNVNVAGFSTVPEPRLVSWNNRGALTADYAVPVAMEYRRGGALQWFGSEPAVLVAGNIFDTGSGRLLLTTQQASGQNNGIHIYDADHLLGVFPSASTKLTRRTIPWADIRKAEQDMLVGDGSGLWLGPGTTANVQVSLGALLDQKSEEIKEVRNALRTAVTQEGQKVEQTGETIIRLSVAKSAQDAAPLLERLMLPADRNSASQAMAQVKDNSVILELLVPGGNAPIWRTVLGTAVDGDLLTGGRLDTTELSRRIRNTSFPYFVPKDDRKVALPVLLN